MERTFFPPHIDWAFIRGCVEHPSLGCVFQWASEGRALRKYDMEFFAISNKGLIFYSLSVLASLNLKFYYWKRICTAEVLLQVLP